MVISDAILIALCALCNRLRGGLFPKCRHCDLAGEIGFGLALAALLDLPPAAWSILALLWLVGARPGWGYPMGQALLGKVQHAYQHPGAKPERWQVGFLKNQPWLSLVVRGGMWAVPALPLAYWHPQVLALLGMAIAMPVAAVIDRTVTYRYRGGEWISGAIMGTICALA